jgi:hypothetical protein
MRRLSIIALSFGLLSFSFGCSDKKKAAEEEPEIASCETNEDCEQGEVCLAKECASAASGAIYTDPSRAVTPDKVKAHVEMINEQAQKRADDILNEAE